MTARRRLFSPGDDSLRISERAEESTTEVEAARIEDADSSVGGAREWHLVF